MKKTNKRLYQRPDGKFGYIEIYTPINLTRKIVGWSLIAIGAITLPFPTGSVFLIMLGASILSMDYKKILSSIKFYSKEFAYKIMRFFK